MIDLHPHMCAVAAYCMLVITTAAYYEESLPSLQQITGVQIPDSETHSLLTPRLAQKYYQQTGEWINIRDPRLYFLTDQALQSGQRAKRTGLGGEPSLSIVNPLDVLRQRLLLEIARRRMRESEEKIEANRQFLKKIGKRSVQWSSLEDNNQKCMECGGKQAKHIKK